MGSVSNIGAVQDLYQSCADQFGAAFARLAAGYEADPDLRRDLVQEIHVALWLSLRRFDARCSLRTWAFRVAHHTADSYVTRQMKYRSGAWVNLDDAQSF